MNKYELFSEHKNKELYGDSAADALLKAKKIPRADKYIPPEKSGKFYGDKPICAYESRDDLIINAIIGEEDTSMSTRGDKKYQRLIVDTNEGIVPIDIYSTDTIITDYMSAIGHKGGQSKSKAKQKASRENGRKGGRPKIKK